MAALLTVALLAVAGCGSDERSYGGAAGGTTGPATTAAVPSAPEPDPGDGDGDGDGDRGPSDRVLAKGALELVLTGRDSQQACGRAMTDEFLTTAYGDLSGCLEGRPKPTLAAAIEIEELVAEGDRISAVVTPAGGLYDGEQLEAVAVREGGRWRVDELTADIPVGP